jgi:hypothetical protein
MAKKTERSTFGSAAAALLEGAFSVCPALSQKTAKIRSAWTASLKLIAAEDSANGTR